MSALHRTVARTGATLALLLAFAVLYLDRLVDDYGNPAVPDVLGVLVPWVVVAVTLTYLTLSLVAGAARWLAPDDSAGDDAAAGEGDDGDDATGGSDGGNGDASGRSARS
jgi:hypothetical protein